MSGAEQSAVVASPPVLEADEIRIESVASETPSDSVRWRSALQWAAFAFVISRAFVIAGAAIVSVARAKLNEDPTSPDPETATNGVLDVLTSWDGAWYFRIVRDGYPRSVPPMITYNDMEARAAFFPVYPMAVRYFDKVCPGGDVAAGLIINAIAGLAFVVMVGVIARRLFDADVAKRAMVVTAMFPGSFVLSFTYSEAVMLFLAAVSLWWLHERKWLAAGLAAAVVTASRPNGIAIAAACAVAAFFAIRDRREWASLTAPALAPIGWALFHIFLSRHTNENLVWFRVQREGWGEGVSLGLSAIKNVGTALTSPMSSPGSMFTLGSVGAMLWMLWALWKVKLPAPMVAYTAIVLGLMLIPDTVTARPRFLFTAFPLFIAFAAWWPERKRDEWAMVMATCGAGLVATVAVYGSFGAIP
jgi:Dolichyl-phosphate-mannose-protein mannosyltransferase